MKILFFICNFTWFLSAFTDGYGDHSKPFHFSDIGNYEYEEPSLRIIRKEPSIMDFLQTSFPCINKKHGKISFCQLLNNLGSRIKPISHVINPENKLKYLLNDGEIEEDSTKIRNTPTLVFKNQLTAEIHIPLAINQDCTGEKHKSKNIYYNINQPRLHFFRVNGNKLPKENTLLTVVDDSREPDYEDEENDNDEELFEDVLNKESEENADWLAESEPNSKEQENLDTVEIEEESQSTEIPETSTDDSIPELIEPISKEILIENQKDKLKTKEDESHIEEVNDSAYLENEELIEPISKEVLIEDQKDELKNEQDESHIEYPENKEIDADETIEIQEEKKELESASSDEDRKEEEANIKGDDSVENYDDYITEEHDDCGCRGKDVVDYDVVDIDNGKNHSTNNDSKEHSSEDSKEQDKEVSKEHQISEEVQMSEEIRDRRSLEEKEVEDGTSHETIEVTEKPEVSEKLVDQKSTEVQNAEKKPPCDEKLYNLLKVIAPDLGKKLTEVSEKSSKDYRRIATNPLDPDFLKNLQKMAEVSSPADIAKIAKPMSPKQALG